MRIPVCNDDDDDDDIFVLFQKRLTDLNTLTHVEDKNTRKEKFLLKQECFESYILSRLLYNTLGMKFLSSFGGKTKSCFLGRREYLRSMVGGNRRRKDVKLVRSNSR